MEAFKLALQKGGIRKKEKDTVFEEMTHREAPLILSEVPVPASRTSAGSLSDRKSERPVLIPHLVSGQGIQALDELSLLGSFLTRYRFYNLYQRRNSKEGVRQPI